MWHSFTRMGVAHLFKLGLPLSPVMLWGGDGKAPWWQKCIPPPQMALCAVWPNAKASVGRGQWGPAGGRSLHGVQPSTMARLGAWRSRTRSPKAHNLLGREILGGGIVKSLAQPPRLSGEGRGAGGLRRLEGPGGQWKKIRKFFCAHPPTGGTPRKRHCTC